MLAPFDAVLFDLDDTLCDDSASYRGAAELVAHEVAALHGIDVLQLTAAYTARSEGFWERLTADLLNSRLGVLRKTLWHEALKDSGLDDDQLAERCADLYNQHRRTNLTLFPGARDLLEELRAAGTKIGLLTNGFSETHREKIAILEIGDCFDAIFIADEVGMIKPDPKLFLHACKTLGSAPERTVMVGDRYDRDMAGALETGMITLFINVHRVTLGPEQRQPHLTVAAFDGVAQALGVRPATKS